MKGRLAATLLALAMFALVDCRSGLDPGDKGGEARNVPVLEVTDGDTIVVRLHREEEKVRLIGVDTPEVYGDAECGGAGASESMEELLRPGDRVEIVPDPTQPGRDRYGRLLRYVEKRDVDLGHQQLKLGWAEILVVGEDPRRLGPYERVQDAAERAGRGIWGACPL